ncbi:putative transcriptional regulator/DNA-binding XRE family transcriptional regulator [Azospirillum lipoferum]|uniref:ImmA/IrrE family metallo-endopeptidase n=1 Tax=Azospirillum lipoferum TaxID=193 RepID=A0A5A9GJT5_AZOLI|nr:MULTISPECIES: short-chain fatty acyl-CoA regulator family protein [Azospirillum]KAA0594105.1 ImmA/IrrE family metallo-endopeptidase [Azospirillum lipoferum]MCP1612598.1 putative transcriptional regulator/DNA-binding XRE family transcriptional regulator [Azospirillum lipoferum]MDW5531619.1 short-chain fatty acyl-CoA regulator family protein [Azospirillum sp. NL1]
MQKKLFLGYKLRRLREQRGLTQASLAKTLELSPSYLNQLENNQRPLTLPVLMRIAATFELELSAFLEDEDSRLVSDLREALADPLFAGAPLTAAELRSVVGSSPELARRVLSLHQAYQKLHERVQSLTDSLSNSEQQGDSFAGPQFPYEEVRDYFHYCNNYIGPLDEAAERLWDAEKIHSGSLLNELAAYLKRRHDVRVKIVADEAGDTAMRSYDATTGTLRLSALLTSSSRAFHMANQIALLEFGDQIDELVDQAKFSSEDARSICRVGLANYFAGALVLPYRAFAAQARALRHDVEQLQSRFSASFEQVCHRLSTLQRPGARGLPFYFVRVDMAGNITKRHSATRFHFARFGGACPLWNVHEAFAQPGKILVQFAQMPDRTAYISIARTVTKRGGAYLKPSRQFAVGLGCEASHAPELVYAAGIDITDLKAAVPIGVNCRLCERTDCQQRAFPPIGSELRVNEHHRSFVPYLFNPPDAPPR